jgi:hypothetical protein
MRSFDTGPGEKRITGRGKPGNRHPVWVQVWALMEKDQIEQRYQCRPADKGSFTYVREMAPIKDIRDAAAQVKGGDVRGHSTLTVIPGWSEGPDPESQDSGSPFRGVRNDVSVATRR